MSSDRKEEQRDRYRRQLRHILSHEEEKARKNLRRQRGRWRDDDADDAEATFAKMHRRPPGPVHRPGPRREPTAPNSAEVGGTVVWLGRGRARVLIATGEVVAQLAPSLMADARAAIAIGDEVMLHERDGAEPLVAAVRPRRSELARADGEHGDRHVLCANVDFVVLVLTADRLRDGLIDRLRLATRDSGAQLVVCVNKCDLPHDPAELARALQPTRDAGIAIAFTAATRGLGIDALRALVGGRAAAFVGHSGVGKSTLLNALDPDAARPTQAVRERDGRGRHTTTASCLRRLADGTHLVDTPGIRMFGLLATASDAAAAFPDLVELAAGCRFRDCGHEHEPGCAVRAAVADGRFDGARYDAYLRLARESR
ncbi:MAG: ribosome small subunit-dependent GTPase A [Planctomycetota bacterium]